MTLVEETKVYKDMYSLLQLILRARKKFDKFYRYSYLDAGALHLNRLSFYLYCSALNFEQTIKI